MAAGAVSGMVQNELNLFNGFDQGAKGFSGGSFLSNMSKSFVMGAIDATTQRVAGVAGRQDWGMIAANAVGTATGSAIGRKYAGSLSDTWAGKLNTSLNQKSDAFGNALASKVVQWAATPSSKSTSPQAPSNVSAPSAEEENRQTNSSGGSASDKAASSVVVAQKAQAAPTTSDEIEEIVVTGKRMTFGEQNLYDIFHPEIYMDKNYRRPSPAVQSLVLVPPSKQGMYDLTKGYINSLNSDDFGDAISWGGAISDATKEGAFGVGKGHANYVLGKAGALHQAKINGILNASSLDEAANLFSSPNGRTASLLTDYSKVVKGAAIAGPLLDLAEFGVDIYQDSSTPRAVITTTVATEVNLLGAYGSAVVGAKLGLEVGTGLSLIPVVTPFAPIVIPVATGLGGAGGYIAYEWTGASDWVKDNTKAAFNSLIDAAKTAPKPWSPGYVHPFDLKHAPKAPN